MMATQFTDSALPYEDVYGHTKIILFIRTGLGRLAKRIGIGLKELGVVCGIGGAVTRYLKHTGDNVLVIDLHEPSNRYTQESNGAEGVDFLVSRAEDSPVGAVGFDAIIFADVLEHIEDPSMLLSSKGRVWHGISF